MHVDLILLSRDDSPPRLDVWRGIESQSGVHLVVHRVIGSPRPDDPNRWETIARARNQAKSVGASPLVMLLDDDVVLAPDCVARLATTLTRQPRFAALAADSAGEMDRAWEHWDYPSHVGMAAVLFRRAALASVTFRWEAGKCECLCCCEDLRAAGWGIGYLQGAIAWHRPVRSDDAQKREALPPVIGADPMDGRALPSVSTPRPARILAAFDRRDHVRFRTHFLATLRESGNEEPVWAFAYGLYPTELERLAAQPGVSVVAIPGNGVCPALRRLHDFQRLVASWPADTPVAYWDAGDVLFQGRLAPLWELVAANPGVLLAVEEPLSHPENSVVRDWSDHILDPIARERAFEVMSTRAFLNSGFLAGTASALLDYLREGDRLLNSSALEGVGDWGDQPALNLYCHANPERWRPIHSAWNYTLAGRDEDEYAVAPDGRGVRRDGEPIYALHGNAGRLRWLDLSPWGPATRLGSTPSLTDIG